MKAPAKQSQRATTVAKVQAKPAGRSAMISFDDTEQMPDYMKDDVGKGRGNLTQEDVAIPMVKLMQGISPEIDQYDGLEKGYFLHTAAGHVFSGPFLGVPLYMNKRYILWNPRESGGGILARADDGVHWSPPDTTLEVRLDKKYGGKTVKWRTARTVAESGLAAWGSMNPDDPSSPPAATLMYTYILAFWEHPELFPAMLTFQRSGIKQGRDLNTSILTRPIPPYGLIYEFSSAKAANKAGQEYFITRFAGKGFVPQPEYDEFERMHDGYALAGLRDKDLAQTQYTEEVVDDEPAEEPVRSAGGRPRY